MSHAMGRVYRDGKIVGYYEYNGTADVTCTRINTTEDEVNDLWRTDAAWRNCACGKPDVDVVLWADYGCGYHWPGKACLECGAITDGFSPYQDEEDYCRAFPKDGLPEGFE